MDIAALSPPAMQALRGGGAARLVLCHNDPGRYGAGTGGAGNVRCPAVDLTEAAGGIKPQALRTALHRLRKDGWIDSRREGRGGAFHFLTDHGRAQAEQAAARIYDFQPVPTDGWHLVVLPDRACILPDHVPVAPGCYLGHGSAPDLPDTLILTGTDLRVPDWVRAQVISAELAQEYSSFEQALRLALTSSLPANPLEATVLRLLAVHGWRRLVLRHPALPDELAPPHDWAGPACRALMAELLELLETTSASLE